jgi:hypothetical protein
LDLERSPHSNNSPPGAPFRYISFMRRDKRRAAGRRGRARSARQPRREFQFAKKVAA